MKWLSAKVLELLGWTFVGELPRDEPRIVVAGYPHTSNWDFFLFLGALHHFGIKVRFLGKAELFRGPLGWLMRRWGGIPVDRGGAHALVEAAVAAFEESDAMILVVAPEGTRSKAQSWKSGFWRIAEAADVPIVTAFIDGATKRVGFGPWRKVDGDRDGWMAMAAEFFADKSGLKPGNRGPISL